MHLFYCASCEILDLNGAYVVHELALNHLHAVTKHFLNSCSFLQLITYQMSKCDG